MKRKTHLWMLALYLLAGTVSARGAEQEKAFIIDEFDFEWVVAKSGKAKLVVNKTHETTRIILREGGMMGDSMWLLPANAEAIGKALADVDKYFAKMRNSKNDVTESVEARDYRVIFNFSKKYGFSVVIRPKKRFSMSSLSLERSQAKAFAPHMQKAKAMVAYVDRKVKF